MIGSSAPNGSSISITGGVGGERPRQPDALALAARELRGVAVRGRRRVEADELEQLVDTFADPRAAASRAAAARWRCCRATDRCGKSPTCWIT